jgi:hypothetical protein
MVKLKEIEAEVRDWLGQLGETQADLEHMERTVDPQQFLGIEINPRAVAIAEVMLWIGWLQWHLRDRKSPESFSEPILQAYGNIEPFIGNKRMRTVLGDEYTATLRATYDEVPDTADYVMYWWDKAERLTRAGGLRRFGLITTNSITQTFNRAIVADHLQHKNEPLSITFAIPDHPWVDSSDGAAVRVAMTSAAAGNAAGVLTSVIAETEQQGEIDGTVVCDLNARQGRVTPELSVGTSVTTLFPLKANASLSFQGMALCGDGFVLSVTEATALRNAHPKSAIIRRYRNGRDVTQVSRDVSVIDFFGLSENEARDAHPEAFQIIIDHVKPVRDQQKRAHRRERYWLFGETVAGLRRAVEGLPHYIATCRTAAHRVFLFLDGDILPDAKIIGITSSDPFVLGILSSRTHTDWALRTGAFLGVGNDANYNHADCFAEFPFPVATEA